MKTILLTITMFCMSAIASAQKGNAITRIARITIDSTKLTAYMKLLREQMNAAVQLEPGVLGYTMYTDKDNPAKITIVEVYADNQAYLLHRDAPHFKRYKEASKDMVLKLELSEVNEPVILKKTGNRR